MGGGEERRREEKERERGKELAFIESILGTSHYANCFSCHLSLTLRVTYTSSVVLCTTTTCKTGISIISSQPSRPSAKLS